MVQIGSIKLFQPAGEGVRCRIGSFLALRPTPFRRGSEAIAERTRGMCVALAAPEFAMRPSMRRRAMRAPPLAIAMIAALGSSGLAAAAGDLFARTNEIPTAAHALYRSAAPDSSDAMLIEVSHRYRHYGVHRRSHGISARQTPGQRAVSPEGPDSGHTPPGASGTR